VLGSRERPGKKERKKEREKKEERRKGGREKRKGEKRKEMGGKEREKGGKERGVSAPVAAATAAGRPRAREIRVLREKEIAPALIAEGGCARSS
jgi:hypothetical protein